MSTRETIEGYFRELKKEKAWQSFLANEMTFTSFVNPVKQVTGKAAYIESTKRFYSMIVGLEVKDMIVDAEKACALTRYQLNPPTGGSFKSDVAEIFTVRNGQIDSLSIFFDTSPFPK